MSKTNEEYTYRQYIERQEALEALAESLFMQCLDKGVSYREIMNVLGRVKSRALDYTLSP